jgi:hypothetical protein
MASPLFFKISATVTTVAIAVTKTKKTKSEILLEFYFGKEINKKIIYISYKTRCIFIHILSL